MGFSSLIYWIEHGFYVLRNKRALSTSGAIVIIIFLQAYLWRFGEKLPLNGS